jgi:hypothetical protein
VRVHEWQWCDVGGDKVVGGDNDGGDYFFSVVCGAVFLFKGTNNHNNTNAKSLPISPITGLRRANMLDLARRPANATWYIVDMTTNSRNKK